MDARLQNRIQRYGWHVEFLMHADEFPDLDRRFADFPVDIVLVVQSLVVLFIAAPPLLRSVFFLPKSDAEKAAKARAKAAKKAVAA